MAWPMKTSGPNPNGTLPQRGACVECKNPATEKEVLFSVDCTGWIRKQSVDGRTGVVPCPIHRK